jgi:DMSO/TMAO reductase YedYZ molybdopterin-dependent catalytic subunit
VITSVGQTVTPLEPLGLLAPRLWTRGPQGVPVNRTADQARIIQAATSPAWTLQVQGPRPYARSLSDLEARVRHQARLAINCVEGWSIGASWRGLSLLEVVVQQAGGTAASRVLVQSFEQDWGHLNGERPDLDHGYPSA